jgi:hypothetical protein
MLLNRAEKIEETSLPAMQFPQFALLHSLKPGPDLLHIPYHIIRCNATKFLLPRQRMHSLLHCIQGINTESKIEERTLMITIHSNCPLCGAEKQSAMQRVYVQTDITATPCRPFDATEKDRQVSLSPYQHFATEG